MIYEREHPVTEFTNKIRNNPIAVIAAVVVGTPLAYLFLSGDIWDMVQHVGQMIK